MSKSVQKINLDSKNRLIIRTQTESFTIYGRHIYNKSISEILLNNGEQLLSIGMCSSNTFTGQHEFVQYTSNCILFCKGNSITDFYCVERVFDIETMLSIELTKDEILKKYNIQLSDKFKNPIPKEKYLKKSYPNIKQF